MANQPTEAQIVRLEEGLKSANRVIEEMKADIAAMQSERDKALKWGVMTLGSAVLGMGYWILEKIIGGRIQ